MGVDEVVHWPCARGLPPISRGFNEPATQDTEFWARTSPPREIGFRRHQPLVR